MRQLPTAMAWVYLAIASVFEVEWAIAMKYAHGFTRVWPTVACLTGMVVSVLFLAFAVRSLPIGTAYAVWTGIGATATAILGMLLFDEPHNLPRLACLLLITGGVVGLRLLSPSH